MIKRYELIGISYLIILSASIVSLSGPQIALAVGSQPPRIELGHLQVKASYSDPAEFGTLVTAAELSASPLIYQSMKGDAGYALATIDGDEYPIRTLNSGKTWRVAGMWFQNDSADAAAFASRITTFSARIAVAYDPSEAGPIYVTADAGVEWYNASLWGTITNIKFTVEAVGPRIVITATVVPYSAKTTSQSVIYRTADGGKRWTLL